MPDLSVVLRQLDDGRYHPPEQLAGNLGYRRERVTDSLARLVELGVPVECHAELGYRLTEPVRPLDAERIATQLRAARVAAADRLHVVEQVDSTNRFLMDWPSAADLRERVCVAECQVAGRGRRGRTWRDAAFRNVKLSIGWIREPGAEPAGGLTLAAGIVVARVLEGTGLSPVGLKWPNDVMWQGRKVAGVLTDAVAESDGSTRLVIGIGINVCEPADAHGIDQPWGSLAGAGLDDVDRDRLCVELILALVNMLHGFERTGFAPWRAEFDSRHIYNGCKVSVVGQADVMSGTVCGIDAQGALRLRRDDGTAISVTAGEVTVRARDQGASG